MMKSIIIARVRLRERRRARRVEPVRIEDVKAAFAAIQEANYPVGWAEYHRQEPVQRRYWWQFWKLPQ